MNYQIANYHLYTKINIQQKKENEEERICRNNFFFFSISEIEKVFLPYFYSNVSIFQWLVMMWDTSVSFTINRYCARFIHSFIRFISSRQRQEHDRHPSLFFFLVSIYSIWFPLRKCKRRKKKEREREVKLMFSFILLWICQKLMIIEELLLWSSIHWTVKKKKKEERQVL